MHEIIEGMSTELYKTCAEIAAEAGKTQATVYAVLSRYSMHLTTTKNGRHIKYRRKTEQEMQAGPVADSWSKGKEAIQEAAVEEERAPLKPPVVVTTPQVLTKRIQDITLKKAFLYQVREKLNLAEKQRLDNIIADYDMIKSCS